MNEFDWEEYWRKHKIRRDLDIFISEHLFNRPVAMYWTISNHDGDDMIDYFNYDDGRDDRWKEPLYEIKKDDYEYHDPDPKYITPEEDIKDGIHRWNLKKIPEYSSNLNLMHRCEEKLKKLSLDLATDYVTNLRDMFYPDGIQFDMIHADAETRAKAIIETLKFKEKER